MSIVTKIEQRAVWMTPLFSAVVYCLCDWGRNSITFWALEPPQSFISFQSLKILFPLSMRECFNLEEITIKGIFNWAFVLALRTERQTCFASLSSAGQEYQKCCIGKDRGPCWSPQTVLARGRQLLQELTDCFILDSVIPYSQHTIVFVLTTGALG